MFTQTNEQNRINKKDKKKPTFKIICYFCSRNDDENDDHAKLAYYKYEYYVAETRQGLFLEAAMKRMMLRRKLKEDKYDMIIEKGDSLRGGREVENELKMRTSEQRVIWELSRGRRMLVHMNSLICLTFMESSTFLNIFSDRNQKSTQNI